MTSNDFDSLPVVSELFHPIIIHQENILLTPIVTYKDIPNVVMHLKPLEDS